MKEKVSPFVENISEATVACLITMVQGNVLALGLTHWVLASQTGIVAGTVASVALLLTSTRNRWVIAVVLGLATAVVDYFVHPGMFGPVFLEAILTGFGAAVLSYLVGTYLNYRRARRSKAASSSS